MCFYWTNTYNFFLNFLYNLIASAISLNVLNGVVGCNSNNASNLKYLPSYQLMACKAALIEGELAVDKFFGLSQGEIILFFFPIDKIFLESVDKSVSQIK